MFESIPTFRLGDASVTTFIVGAGQAKPKDMFNAPRSEWVGTHSAFFERYLVAPAQCVHVQLPEASLLIDAGAHNADPSWPFAVPNYEPPPDLVAQLLAAGIQPESVDLVVITHSHADHFSGLTAPREGDYRPCFPNAQHFLARSDWERTEIQESLKDPDSVESQTLAVVQRQGLLTLVQGDFDLGHGVRIIAAPGETTGHQIVRVYSNGQTLYGIGDLYHHPLEVEHPAWTTLWAEDIEGSLASRQKLTEAALAEDALLIATHIEGCGRLQRTAAAVVWVPVAELNP